MLIVRDHGKDVLLPDEIFKEAAELLKYEFQTKEDVITLTASGTGAMEAAVVNLLSSGDSAIYVNGGKFGERWGQILKKYGVRYVILGQVEQLYYPGRGLSNIQAGLGGMLQQVFEYGQPLNLGDVIFNGKHGARHEHNRYLVRSD